jgi:hypothetical protein
VSGEATTASGWKAYGGRGHCVRLDSGTVTVMLEGAHFVKPEGVGHRVCRILFMTKSNPKETL